VKMRLVITERVLDKLAKKHNVTRAEVAQCFANKVGKLLDDDREEHKTNPPTHWFIAETDAGRELKVIFVIEDSVVFLKSAFDPDETERRMYAEFGMA